MLRFKRYASRIIGLVLCLAVTLLAILVNSGYLKLSVVEENRSDVIEDDPMLFTPVPQAPEQIDSDSYDPVSDLVSVEAKDEAPLYAHEYWKEMGNQAQLAPLTAQGYRLTAQAYEPGTSKIGLLSTTGKFENEFSQKNEKVNEPITEKNDKGGYTTEYKETDAKAPLLRPYYGYIIYTKGNATQLLDKDGKFLFDITGYTPAYLTDLSGNPLFIKEDKYYFYYDGKNKEGVFYSDITNEDYQKLPAAVPTAYQYFTYDRVCLQNFFATNSAQNGSMWGITYYAPEKAGMVEYELDPALVNELKLPSYSYGEVNHGLYAFPGFEYEVEITNQKERDEAANKGEKIPTATYEINISRIFWGYMDEKGNTVIEPQFNKAYNFSEDGYAVVEDRHGHLCTIDTKGRIIHNAYDDKNIIYFPSMGNQKIRDGYYTPDTFGSESTGMLYYDNGHTLVRRILLDTVNGNMVKRESREVVSVYGNRVNYPADYELISYSEGLLLLGKNGRYGLMNTNGDWVVEPNLKYARPFSEGLCVVGYESGKLGVIDKEGNAVIPFVFEHIEDCSGGVITAYSPEGGWSIYHKLTNEKQEKETENPLLTLKYRAIAQARADFYKVKE